MLSYRHSFHAGNFADVLKHIVQLLILDSLKEKEKPFMYLDTHAGAGRYALHSDESTKTSEYLEGIARLWEAKDTPELIKPYLDLIKSLNLNGELRYYPGSPLIAKLSLREDDKLVMAELHPSDQILLKKVFLHDERATIKLGNGFQLLKSHLPPLSRRGLVLIDPSYELKEDYQLVIQAIKEGHKRFATGVFALWYPVVFRQTIKKMSAELKASGIKKILQIELGVKPDSDRRGMTASGMIVINPPWKLEQQMKSILPWLTKQLVTEGRGHHLVDWIVPE
ncbi:23S rRNA (adenine(2030)-N(6))-methyltransferase RlmJ [Thorsellia anophelis]|uniref:Ribosomal RNA large subunit methyltransferase J n=1 Tax=Thorsellia anophelis DSM 18579 TaxID=1123402 RepID=A0A1I0DQ09_9GAMM|nr:23S rRNA (adenine(2030)-N(6))-methyltransferase RlmJ [Thorsellia anophelis]SET34626.1 23S rRNA (adenine2030-N6)-methyltransferase [Thorsellia anophelis DSM 18579]